MSFERGRMESAGWLQLPAEALHELGLQDGDDVLMEIVEGELRVRPSRALRDDESVTE